LKRARHQPSRPSPPGDGQPGGATPDGPPHNLSELRSRLAEAEGTLRAIRTGEVDAVVISGEKGPQVFTLEGAEHAYRVLIESMNEGALTLTTGGTVLYANQCFARMVKCPLEQVTGSSLRRFLSAADRATLRPLVKRAAKAGSKLQVHLHAGDGSQLPVQISLRSLAREGANRATIGMVVTDMTAARRTEELLRTLTQRVVQAQEAERRHVALELHDHITQLVCATLVRSQTLANQLSAHEGALKQEAITLREMLGHTAEEVERISRGLRPTLLDELGLAVVLRATAKDFAERTGVSVKLTCVPLLVRLPVDTELTLYRILQEALKNVEQHARARHVTVRLSTPGAVVRLVIHDDGIGFDLDHHPTRRNGNGGLGLLSMRERAIYSGGVLKIKSVRRAGLAKAGTAIEVRIPLGKARDKIQERTK
jgi:PAS domain S-box-containing protein